MKVKSVYKAVLIIVLLGSLVYSCSNRDYTIKTEYGDTFYVYEDTWSDTAFISCPDRDFDLSTSSMRDLKNTV